jgi:CRISPR-associated protein Csy1
VGNAAALDVYKFLKLEYQGQTLLQMLQADDADLLQALHHDSSVASQWRAAFCSITEAAGGPASHVLAKQIYWPVSPDDYPADANDDSHYHLLSILNSAQSAIGCMAAFRNTALATPPRRHDRQSATATTIRTATTTTRNWQKRKKAVPTRKTSRSSIANAGQQLPAGQPAATVGQQSARLTIWTTPSAALASARPCAACYANLANSSASSSQSTTPFTSGSGGASGRAVWRAAAIWRCLQQQPAPGWTDHPDCQLPLAQQCWLDPYRAGQDADFNLQFQWQDWPQQLAEDFARWLNSRLEGKNLHLAEAEFDFWRRELARTPAGKASWTTCNKEHRHDANRLARHQRPAAPAPPARTKRQCHQRPAQLGPPRPHRLYRPDDCTAAQTGPELDLDMVGVGIINHHYQAQTNGDYVQRFNLSRNPLNKDGSTAAIVEEGRIHLELSLVIRPGTGRHPQQRQPATLDQLANTIQQCCTPCAWRAAASCPAMAAGSPGSPTCQKILKINNASSANCAAG